MRCWIDKENEMLPCDEWNDSYIFTLNRDSYSTIFTGIADTWYRMDCMSIPAIYEDLFVIGISIFAIDKRVSRRKFPDCWTRDITVSIPVLCYEKWIGTESKWNQTLGFLTGDKWNVVFRKCEKVYSKRKNNNRVHLNINNCNCISLFSGGLDSFCGAIKLLEDGMSPCLVGHNEYPKLRKKQEEFIETFKKIYTDQSVKFVSFSANSRAPRTIEEIALNEAENTSRGRSLLFLCAALSIAGIIGENIPVYIPENGFIGLNIPLTNGRKGTCSTRTTHPYFLNELTDILKTVGINNPIYNFFAFSTKREIVNSVKDKEAFKKHYIDTISCSHPCLTRYNKKGHNEYPINCGYCYPCIIRKSSLLDIEDMKYSFAAETIEFLEQYSGSEKSSDLRAVMSSIYRYRNLDDKKIKQMIHYSGTLDNESTEKFIRLYKVTMEDLKEMFSKDKEMMKLIEE
ncbi:Qat anti-phage system QueC-like protein QatC [Clostridium sp.]|jgi:7-cyano-7-deazaguanine synthase in queuosine biosynthesis|uniref:Qat anti-phage system QueC-like protein QatC n=1 Tax=Clostridium sp. TaxID=1506 RepID=UPI002587E963|nr:Qat anti-phage system QueC-like protein QatC [Clostridium sp.]MDF2503032.1 Rossmann-like alpha/beta/alpha sandwich fold [Clostridium sp.]